MPAAQSRLAVNSRASSPDRSAVKRRSSNQTDELRRAALELDRQLAGVPGLVGVAFDVPDGQSPSGLRVLLSIESREARERTPSSFQGYTVSIEVIGEVQLGG